MKKTDVVIPQEEIDEVMRLAFSAESAACVMRDALMLFSEKLIGTELHRDALNLLDHAQHIATITRNVSSAIGPNADLGVLKQTEHVH